jgi:hypothetical protein
MISINLEQRAFATAGGSGDEVQFALDKRELRDPESEVANRGEVFAFLVVLGDPSEDTIVDANVAVTLSGQLHGTRLSSRLVGELVK